MLEWIQKKLTGWPKFPLGEPHPDTPFYVIGDIHGCIGLLDSLLNRIQGDHPVVCVGDYVDRGTHSAQVLRRVRKLESDEPNRFTCLLGNHERMLLGFLEDPVGNAAWLRHGGLQTLDSFGVARVSEKSPDQNLTATRDSLARAMGDKLINWLGDRPLLFESGNVAVVHAAADPRVTMKNQSPRSLLWGHPAFRKRPRRDGVWVVHGHTIVDQPIMRNGVISIDTGAYATGQLSAAFVRNGAVEFITTA